MDGLNDYLWSDDSMKERDRLTMHSFKRSSMITQHLWIMTRIMLGASSRNLRRFLEELIASEIGMYSLGNSFRKSLKRYTLLNLLIFRLIGTGLALTIMGLITLPLLAGLQTMRMGIRIFIESTF